MGRVLVAVAFALFLVGSILSFVLGPGVKEPFTWVCMGLAAYTLSKLV